MIRLTQQEAGAVIAEADRMMRNQPTARLGQAIWWCCGDAGCKLSPELSHKLYLLLDSDRGTSYDFYYWKNEHEVITSFYARYVEE